MNHRHLHCLLTIALLSLAAALPAQNKKLSRAQFSDMVDSLLTVRYNRSPYDSNYVVRPKGTLTLKVRVNQTGNTFHAKGTINNVYQKADFSTSHKTTFAVAAIYRGLGLGISINPAKWAGVYKDYEFNLNLYSSRLSLDLSYQRSSSLSGDIDGDHGPMRLEEGESTLKMLNLAATYTFNHRRFSYPAAFTQSYIQRRSAGSWLAGISYQGGTIETTDELKERVPNAHRVRLYIGNFGIGGGYGYNWVLGRKWLLHLSLMPTFVVYNRNNLTIDDVRRKADPLSFNMIFNERAAIVHFISNRYFLGLTGVANNSIFSDDVVTINQNKWRARGFFGMRF